MIAVTANAALFGSPDWTLIGLVLAIVGCFLLANGILFRNPRAMVAERLGRAPQQLRGIREFVFHRVQMGLGFLFLITSFAVQLVGRWQELANTRANEVDASGAPASSPALWIGATVVVAVALEVVGWWWSLYALRGHVRAYLRDNPRDLDTDLALAREIGELFGIDSSGDDTVQTYVARVRGALGLPLVARASGGPSAKDERRGVAPGFGDEADPAFED